MARIAQFTFVPATFLCIATVWGQGNTIDTALVFTLQGTVYNKTTSTPLQGAKVSVTGTDGSRFSASTDENGGFSFVENGQIRHLNENTTYGILAEKEGYLTVKDQITTVGLTQSTAFLKECILTPAETAICYFLSHIEFDRNSALLHEDADSVVQDMYLIMTEDPEMIVEIRGHNDYKEDPTMSLTRSLSVKDRLIGLGISEDRLEIRWVGSSQPLITEAQIKRIDKSVEREAARSHNRRVQFKILRLAAEP